jgi:hypothetical protein
MLWQGASRRGRLWQSVAASRVARVGNPLSRAGLRPPLKPRSRWARLGREFASLLPPLRRATPRPALKARNHGRVTAWFLLLLGAGRERGRLTGRGVVASDHGRGPPAQLLRVTAGGLAAPLATNGRVPRGTRKLLPQPCGMAATLRATAAATSPRARGCESPAPPPGGQRRGQLWKRGAMAA